jgi:hypothetical protein
VTDTTHERITTDFEDILQAMEQEIQIIDRKTDDLIDSEVYDAIDALTNAYIAEQRGRNAPNVRLSPLKKQIYDAVREVCETRIQREEERGEAEAKRVPVDAIVECLKRLRISIKRWNASNGRRGYIEFTATFFLKLPSR